MLAGELQMPKAIHAASVPANIKQDPPMREGSPIAKPEDSVLEKKNAQEPMTICRIRS